MYLQSRVTRDSLSAVPHMYRVEEFSAKSQQQHQQKYKAPNHLKTLSQFTGYYHLKKFVVFLCCCLFVVFLFVVFFLIPIFRFCFPWKKQTKTKQKNQNPQTQKWNEGCFTITLRLALNETWQVLHEITNSTCMPFTALKWYSRSNYFASHWSSIVPLNWLAFCYYAEFYYYWNSCSICVNVL